MEVTIRYSEAFKQQVLRELEEGKLESHEQARRVYGIGGKTTIRNWIRTYGKTGLMRKVVRVQKAKETSELKQLRMRVRELEKALADAHLDLKLEASYTRQACELAGIEDVEEFKKKRDGQR